MKKIRLLQVAFDAQLPPYQLPAFRAAVAQKAGFERTAFHNHGSGKSDFLYQYPKIQYKLESLRYARTRPMLLCLEQGVEEVHHFFAQPDWTLNILGEPMPLRIAKLDVRQHNLQVWQHRFRYRLHKWQALNQDNYQTWQDLPSDPSVRQGFLEDRLTRHIRSFANGVEWDLGDDLSVKINALLKFEWIEFKKVRTLAFTVDFETNVSLPDFLGLGIGVGEGFGVVRRAINNQTKN